LLTLVVEFVGYVFRAISIKHLESKTDYVLQIVLILVAPAVMAAACEYLSNPKSSTESGNCEKSTCIFKPQVVKTLTFWH
jgi:hypothetical protein